MHGSGTTPPEANVGIPRINVDVPHVVLARVYDDAEMKRMTLNHISRTEESVSHAEISRINVIDDRSVQHASHKVFRVKSLRSFDISRPHPGTCMQRYIYRYAERRNKRGS